MAETFTRELGGSVSEFDRNLVLQAVTLQMASEQMSADVIGGRPVDADAMVRLSSEARRIMGILRAKASKSKPAADPTVDDIFAVPDDVGAE